MSIECFNFYMAWPHPTQAYSVGWGLRFKNEGSLHVPFLVIGIVHAQWGLEEEMRERGYTTFTSTTVSLTTSQIPLATTLPTSTTTARPITTPLVPNTTFPGSTVDPVVTVNTTTTILLPTTSARKTTAYRRFTTPTPVIRSSTTLYRIPTRFTYRPSTRLNPITTSRPTSQLLYAPQHRRLLLFHLHLPVPYLPPLLDPDPFLHRSSSMDPETSRLIDGWTFSLLWRTMRTRYSRIRTSTLLTSSSTTRLHTGLTVPMTMTVAKRIGERAGLHSSLIIFTVKNSNFYIF